MHKGKKAVLMVAAAVLVASQAQAMPAVAAAVDAPTAEVVEGTIRPMWEETSQVFPAIFNKGNTITASLNIRPIKQSATLSGTFYLQERSRSGWKTVASWSIAGTGRYRVDYNYTGKSGVTYRTKIDVTIGTERVSSVSESITI